MNFSLVCWDLQRDLLRILKYKSWSPNSMRASLWKCTPATEMEFQPWRVALEIVHMSQESELQNERIYCVYIYIYIDVLFQIPGNLQTLSIHSLEGWNIPLRSFANNGRISFTRQINGLLLGGGDRFGGFPNLAPAKKWMKKWWSFCLENPLNMTQSKLWFLKPYSSQSKYSPLMLWL